MKKIILGVGVIFIMLLACTRNLVQPKNISIFGNVELRGQSELGGVKASLYPLAEIDSTVMQATNNYTTLGMLQTQANIFDHRRSEPLFTTRTDADGYYEFIDVPQALYNLVIEKRGYGWRYLYNVDGETELPKVTLVREIRQSGVLNSYTEWPAYQHVIVTGNITVPGNGALIVDKGAVIRFDGSYRINGEGQVNCFGSTDEPVWFTSNTVGEYETQTYWAGFNLAKAGTFKDVRMDYAKVAVSVRSSTLTVERGVFSQIIDAGIFASRESVIEVSQSYFYDSSMGIVCETQTQANIHHNVFHKITGGAESSGVTANASVVQTTDNFFNACFRGVSMIYGASGEASHNVINNCNVGVYNFSFDRDVLYPISSNTFNDCSQYFIEIHHASTPNINFNNFTGISGQDLIYAYSKSLYYYVDIDAANNYWDGLPATEASRLIIDDRQAKEGGVEATWKILVEPVAGEMFPDAYPR